MASNIKNLLFSDRNWLVETVAEDPDSIDIYLNSDSDPLQNMQNKLILPDIIGILPIRNAVAFPGTVTPLAIGRQRSKRLLVDTKPNESLIGLLTQRNHRPTGPDSETSTQSAPSLPY